MRYPMKVSVLFLFLAIFVTVGFTKMASAAESTAASSENPAATSSGVQKDSGLQKEPGTAVIPIRGKIVKVTNDRVDVQITPEKVAHIYVGPYTRRENDYKPVPGDWIRAVVTNEDMHSKILSKARRPGYSLEGFLLKIDKDTAVIEDPAEGIEVKLHVNKDTKMSPLKQGDVVEAEFTDDRDALVIMLAPIPVGETGG